MTSLLIRNVPDRLKRRLQQRAKRNRRSMAKEALVLLEWALGEDQEPIVDPPEPFEGRFVPTSAWVERATRAGRE